MYTLGLSFFGCKFSDPKPFVEFYADHFGVLTQLEEINAPDAVISAEFSYFDIRLKVMAPVQSWFHLKESYIRLLKMCEAGAYVFPVANDCYYAGTRDLAAFRAAEDESGCPKTRLFLLNDQWVEAYLGKTLSTRSVEAIVPGSMSLRESSVGHPLSMVDVSNALGILKEILCTRGGWGHQSEK